jgi:tRNA pseudouridine38-40 synthase
MTLWKLVLSYDGTPYNGWQVQPALPTVQGTLAAAIHHVTGETVLPQGSGRTDTGVHALAQVASFSLDVPIPAPNLQRALNRALPSSIRVLSVEPAAPGFHARHSALRKTYEYRIFPRLQDQSEGICSPMLAPFVWDCPWPLDLNLLQQSAPEVLGEHDFTTFAASDPDLATRTLSRDHPHVESSGKSTIRKVDLSSWTARDGLYIYRVTGSGFLHHMVRNLVGTFIDIGSSRLPVDSIPGLLAARDRSAAGPTAPARGLFLVDVEY